LNHFSGDTDANFFGGFSLDWKADRVSWLLVSFTCYFGMLGAVFARLYALSFDSYVSERLVLGK
jgi:hypothetical protein